MLAAIPYLRANQRRPLAFGRIPPFLNNLMRETSGTSSTVGTKWQCCCVFPAVHQKAMTADMARQV